MDERILKLKQLAEENYLDDIYIDQNNLDNESIVTPVQLDKWISFEIVAKTIKKNIEDEFDISRAKVELWIRNNEFDKIEEVTQDHEYTILVQNTKQTADSVKALVVICPVLIERQKQLNELSFLLSIFSKARSSFDKKFSAIVDLTKQFTSNYWAKDSQFKSVINRDAIVCDAKNKIREAIRLTYSENNMPSVITRTADDRSLKVDRLIIRQKVD
jgi:hypothetical protein